MRARLIVGAMGAGVLAFGMVGTGATQSQQPPVSSEQLGHVRVERTVQLGEPWESRRGSERSPVVNLLTESVDTPDSVEEMDVVLTATLDARTSRSDHALLRASSHVENGMPHPPSLMLPGPFKLVSPLPRVASAHHASWAGTLLTQGFPTTFLLDVQAMDGNDADQRAIARGSQLTVVIEMWPAGD